MLFKGAPLQVFPLSAPGTQVFICIVPSFIQDEVIMKELACFWKFTSPMRLIPLAVSFHRYILCFWIAKTICSMWILNANMGIATTFCLLPQNSLRCFECEDIGHKKFLCPHRAAQLGSSASDSARLEQQQSGNSQQESTGESEHRVNDTQSGDTLEPVIQKVSDKHNSLSNTDTMSLTNANNHAKADVTCKHHHTHWRCYS